eukprot:g71106.t1
MVMSISVCRDHSDKNSAGLTASLWRRKLQAKIHSEYDFFEQRQSLKITGFAAGFVCLLRRRLFLTLDLSFFHGRAWDYRSQVRFSTVKTLFSAPSSRVRRQTCSALSAL